MTTGQEDTNMGWIISDNDSALRQMYELEAIQWKGGDSFYDGSMNLCYRRQSC
jgi:hypothetical protein